MSEPSRESRNPAPGASPTGLSRREALRAAATGLTVFGVTRLTPPALSRAAAEHVHAAVAQETVGADPYQPKAFKDHEWQTLRVLAEMILPADDRSGSALDARVPEFIDLLASGGEELQRLLSAGMLWLDHEMRRRHGTRFADADESARRQMLDLLAAKVEEKSPGYPSYVESVEYAAFQHYTTDPDRDELAPGLVFFGWVRRLVVDAFYTTPMGYEDVGYIGNEFLRTYEVPQECVDYAMKRSPFADE